MVRRRHLGVCLDGIAALRQARRGKVPDPTTLASIAETAGAHSIVLHMRDDRRFIQERDLRLLRQTLRTRLNVRMSATQEMLKLAYDIKPDEVTLVPESRDEAAMIRGLDVQYHKDLLRKHIQSLRDGDIAVRAYIDPDLEQIRAAHRLDLDAIVLHTGKFVDAHGRGEQREARQRIVDAAKTAAKLGMQVCAGAGLDTWNIEGLRDIIEIDEFHIGHSIIAQSLNIGLERAVRDMLQHING